MYTKDKGCDRCRTRGIPDSRSRRSDQHDTERETCQDHGKDCPRSLQEVRCNGKRKNGIVRTVTEGTIRISTQCAPILQEVSGRSRIKRIRAESILSLRFEQDNQGQSIHNHLAR